MIFNDVILAVGKYLNSFGIRNRLNRDESLVNFFNLFNKVSAPSSLSESKDTLGKLKYEIKDILNNNKHRDVIKANRKIGEMLYTMNGMLSRVIQP